MTAPRSPLPAPLIFDSLPIARNASVPFSLEIPERRTIAVLGDEDSGIGLLGGYALGLERPASGQALVFGTEVAGLAEPERLAFRRRVGYLPAGDGLLQNLSLRDNVALPLRFGSGAGPRHCVRPGAAHSGAAVRRPDGAGGVGSARDRAWRRIRRGRATHDLHHGPGDSADRPAAGGSGVPADTGRHAGTGGCVSRERGAGSGER